jgi:hypothetical protein
MRTKNSVGEGLEIGQHLDFPSFCRRRKQDIIYVESILSSVANDTTAGIQ